MAKGRKGATLLLLILICTSILILYVASWILETSRSQMQRDTEQSLKNGAAQQVALLTVWYGEVANQIKSFVDVDMLRLFASEVDSLNIDPNRLRSLAQDEDDTAPNENPDPNFERFAERMPGLNQLLSEFVQKNSFFSAAILSRDGTPYLRSSANFSLRVENLARVREVVESGRHMVLPIHKVDQELAVAIAYPVFAPKYIDQKGTRVVAVFVGILSVQQAISAVDQLDAEGFFTSAVLEKQGEQLAMIDPLFPGGRRSLAENWAVDENGLPLAVRAEPTRMEKTLDAYTLAIWVPDVPWLVMQGIRVPVAEASYIRFRKNIYIGVGLSISLIAILLTALWWWIVGRRERAMADQMRKLYVLANEQKQILDSVNSALSAGIVLNDLSGIIYYVNQSYAKMAKMAPERMFGMPYTQLPYPLANSLVTHTLRINETPALINFTETLEGENGSRHYLTACSPCTDENNYLTGMVSVYSDITDVIEAQERAQRMVTQTVEVLVRAVEAIDPYLRGQSASMAVLAINLAACLKKDDPETRDTLRIAASLSQIGMIQLPRSLLLKTGSLSAEERKHMQKHIEFVRTALHGVDFGLPVLEAITEMYERMDGSGYPDHLRGDEICFNARILAVANTFCALMRPRSYRTAHTTESALQIFEEKPYKYDQEVTQALRDYLKTESGIAFVHSLVEDTETKDAKDAKDTKDAKLEG